jgi:hypothetical protein
VSRLGLKRAHCMGVAMVAVGALAGSSLALAGPQAKGGSYKGTLSAPRTTYIVSLKVSRDGKRVTNLRISNTPFFCSGGGRPTPVSFPSAQISGSGTFTSKGKFIISEGPLKGQVGALLTLTGQFAKGRREQGKVTTIYPGAASCNGSARYQTKG